MTYNISIPHKFEEGLTDISKSITHKVSFEYGLHNKKFQFESEVHRDFIAECFDRLEGKSKNENIWKPGTIIMGTDQSYERSHYEVIADNGIMVLMLFRRLGPSCNLEYSQWTVIRSKEIFKINTDHLLTPSNLRVELPVNWVADFEHIKLIHQDKPESKVHITPPQVYYGGYNENEFTTFEKEWLAARTK